VSLLHCDECDDLVDTDADPGCLVSGADVVIACKPCRERMAEAGELDFETNTLVAP
jgi:hypothetical protein